MSNKDRRRVSDEKLGILIGGLQKFKARGVVDPWILSDGTVIEPLDILIELREYRRISKIVKERNENAKK